MVSFDIEKILKICTLKDLLKFCAKYYSDNLESVDWTDVFSDYHGIYFGNLEKIKNKISNDKLNSQKIKWLKFIQNNSCCLYNSMLIMHFVLCIQLE